MDSDYAKPFVDATIKTFEVMLGVNVAAKEGARLASSDGYDYDVSAFAGISGTGVGGVVLGFSAGAACKAVSMLVGEEYAELNEYVTDGVGELVNIIAGNAKCDLSVLGVGDLTVSLPSVVIGRHRTLWRSKDTPCLRYELFCNELGSFGIEVNFRVPE
ncbi:MAG: chemotaxis protein CheX [Planctomycetota bacterium]|jgi:chemotaxis protein CheX